VWAVGQFERRIAAHIANGPVLPKYAHSSNLNRPVVLQMSVERSMLSYLRRRTYWNSEARAVALSLLCVGTGAVVAAAADESVYRERDFNQTDINMTACPAAILSQRHEELQFVIGMTDGHFSLSGARSKDSSSVIWLVVAKSTGPKSSHVELRNKSAESYELNEVWQAVEACERQ
jgi:hypothetical protein